jgi:DNA-directed RNA polymerase subunit delta
VLQRFFKLSHSEKKDNQASTPRKPAASVAAEQDDAIWTSIIELMPIPKDQHLSDKNKQDTAVLEVLATWRSLLHLRLVSKKLAALLHPGENAALWWRLVLQSFDFSTYQGFHFENYKDDHGLDVPSDEVESEEEEEEEEDTGEADGDHEGSNEESDEDEGEDGDEEDGDDEEAKAEGEMESETEEPNKVSTDENIEETDEEADEDPQLVAMRGRYRDIPSEYLLLLLVRSIEMRLSISISEVDL